MPFFEHDGARIHYEVRGEGPPVLALAPGGMRSNIGFWATKPWRPWPDLTDRFRVIAMDQRNAGESTGPIEPDHGWRTYARDQLALMDHLGIARFSVVGMCIGGAFGLRLTREAPDRIAAAVLMQPIGRVDNRGTFFELFDTWAQEIAPRHPDVAPATWAAFRQNMFGGDAELYGATLADAKACRCPLLVLLGDDIYHPSATSRAVVDAAPRARLVESWKAPADHAAVDAEIRSFLAPS